MITYIDFERNAVKSKINYVKIDFICTCIMIYIIIVNKS